MTACPPPAVRCLLRHRWEVIEAIGLVTTQRCTRCGKTRVRVL
ncbi:hypothetical protein [Streptosporangium sp. NPDC004631]